MKYSILKRDMKYSILEREMKYSEREWEEGKSIIIMVI